MQLFLPPFNACMCIVFVSTFPVDSGFQILPTSFLGRIQGHDGTRKGGIVLHGTEIETVQRYECDFDFTINPI